jgi:hypothetical protein
MSKQKYKYLTDEDVIRVGDEFESFGLGGWLAFDPTDTLVGTRANYIGLDIRRPIPEAPIDVQMVTLHPDEYNALKADSDTLKAILEILNSK